MSELSKVKIGGVVYDLKDATARENIATMLGEHALEALGAAAWKAVAANISGTGLVEASVVKDYVDSQVGQIHSFDVVIDATGTAATGPSVTASADTMYKIYMVPSDEAAAGDYIEYITIRSGAEGAYTYKWEAIGNTKVSLTGYVPTTTTVCEIALDHNITIAEIKSALALKALAYKDEASTTLSDYATGIKAASYTPAGTVEVESTVTSTEIASTGSYTPAGNVSGTTTAAGSVTIARNDAGVQITGSVSAPTITVTPATAKVQHITDVGSLPTYTNGSYTAPSVKEVTSAFATQGVVAAIDGNDAEMLVFSNAATSNALTSTGFNAGSYTAPTYVAGSLPVLGDEQTVVTGITSATASAPTFTGDKFGATFAGEEADITASFTGTAGAVNVKGNYDKTTVGDATFTGTKADITPTLTTGSKTVTVK